ncbi:unnamed protein product [Enterobius vermicularis]|uniref:MOSC domain-containing protein n=1 Tax=Enterobius vermicularis TaxID=51028 RepID=A0A0N4UV19_ENTVE|nr:unnamed protein product [Enterobius vermicularis]
MSSASGLLDVNVQTLKEGDVVTNNETGKHYFVRKTVLSPSLGGGPHGLGDPDDRSLRRLEAEAVIPRLMDERLEKVECRSVLNG